MRIGGNEHKFKHQPVHSARVTAAVVTFLPDQIGYFQDRLAVIKLSLASLLKHADLPVDLLVFDNGSCHALVDYLVNLKEQGLIHILLLNSTNGGLAAAYRAIANVAPGEIIAFANDDVFYFPGWLAPQVAILDGMPDVGLVSGAYLRGTHPRTAQLAVEKGLTVDVVRAPDEWLDEFCRDASYPSREAYTTGQKSQGWTDLEDRLISHHGVTAYAGGVCWQAVFRKETIQQLLPRVTSGWAGFRSYDGHFHEEIVRRGYLRLSAPSRLVRHLGNVITPELSALAARYGVTSRLSVSHSQRRAGGHPLMRFPPSRWVITVAYNFLYRTVKSS